MVKVSFDVFFGRHTHVYGMQNVTNHYKIIAMCYNWRAQWKKGITVFDDSKGQRSKVNKAFSLSSKPLWLKFNSWICVLLKSSLVIFLDTKKCSVDLWPFGIIKNGYPLFPLGPSIGACGNTIALQESHPQAFIAFFFAVWGYLHSQANLVAIRCELCRHMHNAWKMIQWVWAWVMREMRVSRRMCESWEPWQYYCW